MFCAKYHKMSRIAIEGQLWVWQSGSQNQEYCTQFSTALTYIRLFSIFTERYESEPFSHAAELPRSKF